MGGFGLGLCLGVTLAALPVPPAPATRPPAQLDPAVERDLELVASWLDALAQQVVVHYPRKVTVPLLLTAGLTALYEKADRTLPDEIAKSLQGAAPGDRKRILIAALRPLAGPKGMGTAVLIVVAANGFSRATDQYSELVFNAPGASISSTAEFGVGFELEGVSETAWITYLIEFTNTPDKARPPIGERWVVKRVIPGSTAAKAGLRPGDRITHYEGEEVNQQNNAGLFRKLSALGNPAFRQFADPTVDVSAEVSLRVVRGLADKPREVKLARTGYRPESVFGVTRNDDGTWDYLLDREAKIGYIRLAAIEESTGQDLAQALNALKSRRPRGVILDLRWVPGGYISQIEEVVSAFLPPGKIIATYDQQYDRPARSPGQPNGYYTNASPIDPIWKQIPLAVLVNRETTGGGEMIVAALKDHNRVTVIGQRTFGKSNVMQSLPVNLHPALGYRVTTGFLLRPDGKRRHRLPEHKPTDEWGIRPDRGFEVPTTSELSSQLQRQAELHTIRPAGSTEVVEYDDPLTDPQRLIALKLFKEKLTDEKAPTR